MNNIEQKFVWWMGVVEDRQDPLMIGRCRVRILGYHTDDKTEIPTEDLPWAYPAMPINTKPRGTPVGPVEGTWVMGFFRDGENAQQPVMTHNIDYGYTTSAERNKGFSDPEPGASNRPRRPSGESWPDDNEINTHRLSRGEKRDTWISRNSTIEGIKTAAIGGVWDEVPSEYRAKYPYNSVSESESGHVAEVDDTPGAERLVKRHRSGTFEEIFPDGSRMVKVVGKYDDEIITGNKRIFVKNDENDPNAKGDMNLTVEGDLNIRVTGTLRFDVGKQFRVKTHGQASIGAIVLQAGVAGEKDIGKAPILVNGTLLGTAAAMPIFHGGGSPFVIPSPMPPSIAPDLGLASVNPNKPSALELEKTFKEVQVDQILINPQAIGLMANDPQEAFKASKTAVREEDIVALSGTDVVDIQTRTVQEEKSVRQIRVGRNYTIRNNGGLPLSYWKALGAESRMTGTTFKAKGTPSASYFNFEGTQRNPTVLEDKITVNESVPKALPGTSMTDRLVPSKQHADGRILEYELNVADMMQIKNLGVLLSVVAKVYTAREVAGFTGVVDISGYLGVEDYTEILTKISLGTAAGGISSILHLTNYIDDLMLTRKNLEARTNLIRTGVGGAPDTTYIDLIKNSGTKIVGELWGKRAKVEGNVGWLLGKAGLTEWYRKEENHTFLITHPAVTDSGWGKNNYLIFTPRGSGMKEKRGDTETLGKKNLYITDFIREYNYQREK